MRPEQTDAPLATRERQRLQTRNLILKIATSEISELGLSGVRIEHIARKAGVTRPTVYAHFPEKEDFLRALETRSQAHTLDRLTKQLDGTTGANLLHRLVDAIFDLIETADPVLRREVFALIVREPAEVDWAENPFFAFLTAQLEESQERGEIAADLAAANLTQIIMMALFGFITVESNLVATRRRDAHHMIDLVVSGRRP